ncbi:hypothetical protein [Pseudomonas nitroreducens]|uniref:hypothetical protein n=1 Tax=Pseudomonas nitroreducens TaxID=46680 RepID=UPI003CC835DD
MPKVTINQAFHFREGDDVKRYPAGDKPVDVPQAVADYAKAKGFLAKEKAAKPTSAEPAAVEVAK